MPQTHLRTAATVAGQMVASGVRHVVITPGSRSTPLTLALTAQTLPIRTWLHLDERSAGYFALGIARQLREPVALVCTSGTAAANFLPAIVEASLSRVPLLVLTADRPPELRDLGAAQTIDQVGLFGTHARWSVDLPVATGEPAIERHAQEAVARALAVARATPAGPVHVNFPFREPLIEPLVEPATAEALPTPPEQASFIASPRAPSPDQIARIASELVGRRGVLVAGPESSGLPAAELARLGDTLGWPIIADPLSGLRTGDHDLSTVIDCADLLAREPGFTQLASPEVIMRLGGHPTSKPLNSWLEAVADLRTVIVDAATARAGLRDPDSRAGLVVQADPAILCRALERELTASSSPRVAGSWLDLWLRANQAAAGALEQTIAALPVPFEGQVGPDLATVLPEASTLVVGNSMPIRDIDSFFPRLRRSIRLVGTRGAAGIDGVVSTAAGAAAVSPGPVVLLVGDLSFFHDQNGLWPVHRYGLDLTILLVNNNGGGIFEFLPQRQLARSSFEAWFGTPHGLDFSHTVRMYGGRHELVTGDLRSALRSAIASPGLSVVELRTDRRRNVTLHEEVFAEARAAVRAALAAGDDGPA